MSIEYYYNNQDVNTYEDTYPSLLLIGKVIIDCRINCNENGLTSIVNSLENHNLIVEVICDNDKSIKPACKGATIFISSVVSSLKAANSFGVTVYGFAHDNTNKSLLSKAGASKIISDLNAIHELIYTFRE